MTTSNEPLQTFIQNALQEDVGDGDHSALCCIPPDTEGKAQLIIKEDGIIAGIQVAENILRYVQPDTAFTPFLLDGDEMHSGTVGFEVKARIHAELYATNERHRHLNPKVHRSAQGLSYPFTGHA